MCELAKIIGEGWFKSIKSFKRFRCILVAASFVMVLLPSLIAVSVSANPGLTVSDAAVLVDVTPGETFTQKITVAIASMDPATDISAQVAGMGQSSDGGYQLLDASDDTGQYSARQFVTLDKSSFHLAPGGSEIVTATIQVPQNVGAGGRYAIINFATQPVAASGVNIITAVDVPVSLTISGSQLVHTGKITGLSASDISIGQPVNIFTDFQNTGNHHFKVQGQVTINNAEGQTVDIIAMPVTVSSVLPGMTRQLEATLPATDVLTAGTYSIDSKVMLEDGTLLDEATNTFEVATPNEPSQVSTTSSLSSTPDVTAGLLPGMDPSSLVSLNFNNGENPYLDAIQQDNTEVNLTGISGSGSIIVGKYSSEPPDGMAFSDGTIKGGTGKTAIKFVDIRTEGYTLGTARVTIHYTDGEINGFDPNSLLLAYYSGNEWHICGNVEISASSHTVSGDIPVARLTGTIVGLGGNQLQSGNAVPLVSQSNSGPTGRGISWSLAGIVIGLIIIAGGVVFVVERNRRKTRVN